MRLCRSGFAFVIGLLLCPVSALADDSKADEGQADEKTKETVSAFLKAVKDKDVSRLMKTSPLPWLDEKEGVIKDEKNLEMLLKKHLAKLDFSKVKADDIHVVPYSKVREEMIKDGDRRKQFDEVLGKDGFLAVVVGGKERGEVLIFLARPRGGKPVVVGGPFSIGYLINNKVPASALAILEKADQVELLSLDPSLLKELPKGAFGRWRVLGKTVVKDAGDRKKIIAALNQGAAESDGSAALCFNPRHGLRASHGGKTVELFICFECLQVQVSIGEKQETYLTTGSPQAVLDKILSDAKVPLPPKPGK